MQRRVRISEANEVLYLHKCTRAAQPSEHLWRRAIKDVSPLAYELSAAHPCSMAQRPLDQRYAYSW